MKTKQDLKELLDQLKNNTHEYANYSDLEVDERCTEPLNKCGIWSWAEPIPEFENRPRFLLVGDHGPDSWEIIDIFDLEDYEWPLVEIVGNKIKGVPDHIISAVYDRIYANLPPEILDKIDSHEDSFEKIAKMAESVGCEDLAKIIRACDRWI